MGRVYLETLFSPSSTSLYSCRRCCTHLALGTDRVSRNFRGQTGRAILFARVVNVVKADRVDRNLITGLHTIEDARCASCGLNLGWTYVRAFETDQKYKENKTILERARCVKIGTHTGYADSSDDDDDDDDDQ